MREISFNTYLCILLLIFSCTTKTKKMEITKIIEELSKQHYNELFLYNNEQKFIGEEYQTLLEEIFMDAEYSQEVRFLASELILQKRENYITPKNAIVLSGIYVKALQNTEDYELSGNLWGFLDVYEDFGVLGNRIMEIGTPIIIPLSELLENDVIVSYEGSRNATTMNAKFIRVKDIAAFYISKITEIPITFYQDLEKRDVEIERFKTILKN